MKIEVSSSYIKAYKKIAKKNPQINIKVKKKLKTYLKNPKHPSLRLHKLKGTPYKDWSLSITKDIRLIFSYTKGGIILVDIGPHDKVD